MSFVLPVLRDKHNQLFPVLPLFVAGAGAVFCFPLSYLSHSNVVIGLLLFPFTLFIAGRTRNNYVYLICVLLFGILALTYRLRIGYFFMIAFFVVWLVELLAGKCHPLIVLLLAFMSPIFSQVTTILGFPLRLQLSRISASLLQMTGLDAQAQGNMIVFDGLTFSVDEACMGLSMLAMSMLMGVFIIGYRFRKSGRQAGLFKILIFFGAVFALNLITNVLRIVLLVLFRIPPENFMHEIVGLLCFAAYIVLPLFLLSAGITRNGQALINGGEFERTLTRPQKILMMVIALGVCCTGIAVGLQKVDANTQHADVLYSDGQVEKLNDGITKITTGHLLIYVKPIPEFFTGEHTPLMCWKGSGYALSGVKEVVVHGKTIYAGKLAKQTDVLFTAWWYSNGKVQTIDQFDWRARMLKGEDKFCLVNITAKDEKTLLLNIASVFQDDSLSILYP